MSESIPRFIFLYVLLVLSGCSGSNQNKDSSTVASEAASEELKDVNDLTYMEVVELVFKDGASICFSGYPATPTQKSAQLSVSITS